MTGLRPVAACAVPVLAMIMVALLALPGAFNGGVWAIVGIGGALALYGLTALAEGGWPRPDRGVALFVLMTLALAAGSGFWALNADVAWHGALQLASILLPLMLLSCPAVQVRASSTELFRVWPWLAALGFAALGLELALGGPLIKVIKHVEVFDERLWTKYNRGLSYGMLMAWPALAALGVHNAARSGKNISQTMCYGIWCVALILPLIFTHSRTTLLGMPVGLVVLGVACVWPRLAERGLMALVLLCVVWPVASVFVLHHHQEDLRVLPGSFLHRLEIWDYMAWRIHDRPWFGWGLGNSHLLDWSQPDGALFAIAHGPAAHPHNAYTEWWVELGLPGVLLGVAAVIECLRLMRRLDARLRPWAMAAFASSFVMILFAYDFWTDSLLATLAMVMAVFAILNRKLSLS